MWSRKRKARNLVSFRKNGEPAKISNIYPVNIITTTIIFDKRKNLLVRKETIKYPHKKKEKENM